MFENLLALLKTTYAKAGLSETALKAIATELAKTVTTTEAVQAAVDGVAPMIAVMQAEADRRAEAAKKPADPKPADPPKVDPPKTDAPADKVTEMLQTLLDQNKALNDRIGAFEAGNTAKSRKEQFAAKLATTPDALKSKLLKDFDKMTFADQAAFDAHLTETEEDLKGLVQQGANQKLGAMGIPVAGQNVDSNAPASKEEVANVTKLFK